MYSNPARWGVVKLFVALRMFAKKEKRPFSMRKGAFQK